MLEYLNLGEPLAAGIVLHTKCVRGVLPYALEEKLRASSPFDQARQDLGRVLVLLRNIRHVPQQASLR